VTDHEDDGVEPVCNRLDPVTVVIAALSVGGVLFFACYAIVVLVFG